MPLASVLQTQHHLDHVPRSLQHLQRLSDACVASHPADSNSGRQGALGGTPATGGGIQAVCSAELGASPSRCWTLADASRALQYARAVQSVMGRAGPRAVCIVSGAAASLALMAAACSNVDQVICLQVQRLANLDSQLVHCYASQLLMS